MAPANSSDKHGQCGGHAECRLPGIRLTVRTYSGYKADERPVSFTFGEKTCDVVEIIDRWYGLDHAYFKLRASDGNLYVLRHHLEDEEWEMVMMEAGGASAKR